MRFTSKAVEIEAEEILSVSPSESEANTYKVVTTEGNLFITTTTNPVGIGDFMNVTNMDDVYHTPRSFFFGSDAKYVASGDERTGDFGFAIQLARAGKRVTRKGWNGADMFAYIVPGDLFQAQTGAAKAHFGECGLVQYREYWALKTTQGDVAVWAPSGSDSLANDWMEVTN